MALTVEEVEAILRLRDQMSPELPKAQKNLSSFASTMSSIGTGMTAAITLPIAAIGGAAAKMGMDAVESENLFSVAFGDMQDSARAWSEDLSDRLGLNEYELRKTSATIFTMTESMGLSKSAAFDMATGMSELSADMASFFNLKPEEAFQKLRAGIVGEAEPLKALGILVDETTVKTAAYKHGIAEMGATLTQQEKVQARWAAILDQTSKAQGDLARTIDSPTNQMRLMKARVEELTTEFGIALLPVISKVIGVVGSLIPYLEKAVNWFTQASPAVQTTIVAFAGVAAAIGPILLVAAKLIGAFTTLMPIFTAVSTWWTTASAAGGMFSAVLTGITGAFSALAAPVLAILAVGAGILTATGTWGEFFSILKSGAGIIVDIVSIAFKFLSSFVVAFVKDTLTIVKAVADWTGVTFILEKLGQAFAWVMKQVAAGLSALGKDISDFNDTLSDTTQEIPKMASVMISAEDDGLKPMRRGVRSTATEIEVLTDAQKKAREEAAKYRKEVLGMVRVTAGAEEEYKKLTDGLRMAGGATKLTVVDTKSLAEKVDDLRAKGVALKGPLADIWLSYMQGTFNSKLVTTATQATISAIAELGGTATLALPKIVQMTDALRAKVSGAWETVGALQALGQSITTLPHPPPEPWIVWKDVAKGMIENVGQTLGTHLSDMLTGAVGFKDGLKGIWEDIKKIAITTLSDIATAYISGFLKDMLMGTEKSGIGSGLVNQFQEALPGIASFFSKVGGWISDLVLALGPGGAIVAAGLTLGKWLSDQFGHMFTNKANKLLEEAMEKMNKAREAAGLPPLKVPKMDSGGTVTKTGLALVHEGEQVVPAKHTPFMMPESAGFDDLKLEMKGLRRDLRTALPALVSIAARDARRR